VGPFSQKQPFAARDVLIQGDSVRQTWGVDDAAEEVERKPLRREPPNRHARLEDTDDGLRLRLGEELDFARRMLDITGDELSSDPIAVSRHGMSMQSLDIVGQMLGHIANVIRSSDPEAAVDEIGMCDLRARLKRSGAL
jgi:hypothetical protein